MSSDFAEGVKFGLAFGLRYKQMEYLYSKLASDCKPLRNMILASKVNTLSSQHLEFLSDVEDALNSSCPNLKDVLNQILDSMKQSKVEFCKLSSEVMDLKSKRLPSRKRKAKTVKVAVTPETPTEEDAESS
jgi:ABC-type transporter Mla subunit MlaD